MKIITDTLKENGKWSISRLTMLATLVVNFAYAGYETYSLKKLPDLPTNWLALVLGMYGIQRAGQAADKKTEAV